jgi:hypothetical protein
LIRRETKIIATFEKMGKEIEETGVTKSLTKKFGLHKKN